VIAAVILAAGASTRMGTSKLLLQLGDEPIVRRTARQVCEAGFADVLVILGLDAEQVRAALDGLPCRFATNAEYRSGMGSSFRTAVEHLGECEAAMFTLADQPFVTSDQYRRLREAYAAAAHDEVRARIVCARYGNVTAPPHVFARDLFADLARLEHGARPLLVREAASCLVLDFPSDQLIDIDTPDDYARARKRLDAAGGICEESRRSPGL
jgi:molybdenum cofactor cytidylyltransferase